MIASDPNNWLRRVMSERKGEVRDSQIMSDGALEYVSVILEDGRRGFAVFVEESPGVRSPRQWITNVLCYDP